MKWKRLIAPVDLTRGSVPRTMLAFALPMVMGNMFQQVYNLADTLVVGYFLGVGALAAVGAAYTLLIFLNSIQLGLCMGSGVVFSIHYGARDGARLMQSRFISFAFTATVTLLMNVAVYVWTDPLMRILQVPADIYADMRLYLHTVFGGLFFTFLYNYYASLLRAVGNSSIPLLFLVASVALNIVLDILFVACLGWGIAGAAWATVVSQAAAALGLLPYAYARGTGLKVVWKHCTLSRPALAEILQFSSLTCLQQSVMNLGILAVQGLVNSFGTIVMAAFTVAVKIDTLAYMPAQDFGNAFSTFIAQNFGAGARKRIRAGIRAGIAMTLAFCALVSVLVYILAPYLMRCFVEAEQEELIAVGVRYLRIEGAFYIGIGCLFLLYGYYRAIRRPGMSVALTVISLGTRVALAYILAAIPSIGVDGIWWAIPIGWFLADLTGLLFLRRYAPARIELHGKA